MDIARSEAVEADLDRLIERRSRKGEVDPDEREALWQTSVRRYNARRREEMRAAWAFYHEGQAERHRATLQALIEHHESEAARLMDVRPKGAWGEQSTAPGQRLPGQGGNAPAYEIPYSRLRGLGEDGRPCERAHGPRLDRRKVEVEMIYKRAANHWKRPTRFERTECEQEEESQPLRRKSGRPRSLKDITKAKPRRRAPWK